MKPTLIFLALAGLTILPALAETAQPHAPGIEAKDYRWNEPSEALSRALKQKGDPEKGKIAYEGCRGCHKADGSGRPDALKDEDVDGLLEKAMALHFDLYEPERPPRDEA